MDPGTQVSVKQNKDQSVDDFVRAMRNGIPHYRTTSHECGIIHALMQILAEYNGPRKRKPMTILILTDGIWEGINENSVETLISAQIRILGLGNRNGPHDVPQPRPLTFQFISFGDDPEGLGRLERLDNGLEKHDLPLVYLQPLAPFLSP